MKILQENIIEILDRITDGFFALDASGRFTYMNEAASYLLFRNRNDLIGKSVWEEFPEVVHLSFYKQYHKALAKQIPVTFDTYFPPLDTWFDVRVYPSSSGLSVFFKDITEQKKILTQHEQHYKSLFEQNSDAVYAFDLKGNYLSVNSKTEKMLGYTEEELLQLSFGPLVYKDDLERVKQHYQNATNGMTQNYEARALHKDGHIVHVNVTNIPIIVDGDIVGVYGIAKDITMEKQTEERLLRSEKLSAVGQLSASIAHEIRNPLTSLKGFLQLMKTSSNDNLQDYFCIMLEEINRIETITGELLLLAKPQVHQFQFEDIKEMIKNVVILIRSQALMNKIDIVVNSDELPLVNCIGIQIKQVFINLIKNAIESMPDGGKININLQNDCKGNVFIQVIDHGCGIPEELLPKIGLPFYTTKDKGTGLGMMTTLKIIEAHGGTVDILSEAGKGTTINIYMPVNPLAAKNIDEEDVRKNHVKS